MKRIEEDIIYITNQAKLLGLMNKSFLITGATGMIGKIFVCSLMKITPEERITVLGYDFQDVEKVYGDTRINLSSFDQLDKLDVDVDYVIHLASPTNPLFLKEKPVETISFIYESTKHILDFSMKHHSKVLYISSMEAYGEVFDESIKTENELGYIPLTNTRSSYPETKRLCELLCHSYNKEFGLNVCSARLAQTFGAGTPSTDPRIFGYLGRCVVKKENIVLKTTGESYGNYCYISDTLAGFLFILAKGISGETYNIVGTNCRSTILNMATMVANEIAKKEIKIDFDLADAKQYPNPTKLNMSNMKLIALGWHPQFQLIDMFIRMLDSWNE